MSNLHIFSMLLFSISICLDNFGVGVAYGIRGLCIPVSSNLLIAALNSGGTFISMLIGERLYHFMQPATAKYMGPSVFLIAGCIVIVNDIAKKHGMKVFSTVLLPEKIALPDKKSIINIYCKGRVGLKEGALLAIALTFSNLVTGAGASLIGLSLAVTTIFVFVLSVFAISVGMRIGNYSGGRWLGDMSDPLSGVLLIIIGIYEMVS